MSGETDVGWDGGYEDLVDSGDEVEELYIGPHQLYDMPGGHVPDERFATRHEVPGRRPRDPVEEAPADAELRPSSPARRATKKQARTAASARPPATSAAPAGVTGSAGSSGKPLTKKERRNVAIKSTAAATGQNAAVVRSVVLGAGTPAEKARRAGISASLATEIQRCYVNTMSELSDGSPARSGQPARPTGRRPTGRATPAQLAHQKSTARRGKKSKAKQSGAKRTRTSAGPLKLKPLPVGPRWDEFCQSCQQPIRGDSSCGCS